MNNSLICLLHTVRERDVVLMALRMAGIPPQHIAVETPRARGDVSVTEADDELGNDWPLADGVVCGGCGALFGVYVAVLCVLFPDIGLVHNLGPVGIVLASLGVAAVIGSLLSMAIKSCIPHHEARQQADSSDQQTLTLVIHPDDPGELQQARDALIATGHDAIVQPPEAGDGHHRMATSTLAP